MSEARQRIVTQDCDLQYIRSTFLQIDCLRPGLPAPCYFDLQGRAYVPSDYLDQECDRDRFYARARRRMTDLHVAYGEEWLADIWSAYLGGIYGICLKVATPENIVRKQWLLDVIDALLATVEPHGEQWLQALAEHVNELDDLERDFCAFDRAYFGRPVSRDIYITALRKRYGAALSSNASSAALRSCPQR